MSGSSASTRRLQNTASAIAASAQTAYFVDTPELDCGTVGHSGSRERVCGGGLWAPSGPLLVPRDGGYELVLASGNGQLDLTRADYANTLMRAGPGTGKTWMIKQAAFMLADSLKVNLGSSGGIRLVPIVVYVQRVVYLIRDGGSGKLLQLYIEANYAGKKYETWRKMLTQAYEMRALVVLIDGVDEAAGLRDEIEAFVHKELVPSGNRVLVTSRPEGVTLPRYTGRFVIMNLNELTNEQQRKVINIQMHGSLFFDHLLSLGEV